MNNTLITFLHMLLLWVLGESRPLLEVHVIPHSHQDVGWVNTINTMYDGETYGVKHTYDTAF